MRFGTVCFLFVQKNDKSVASSGISATTKRYHQQSMYYFIIKTLPYLLELAPLLERAHPLLKIKDYIGQKQRITLQCVKNNPKN